MTETTRSGAALAGGQTMALSDARENLRAMIDDVLETGSTYTITRHGRNVAVVLSFDEYESLIETLNILGDDDAMDAINEAEAEFGQATPEHMATLTKRAAADLETLPKALRAKAEAIIERLDAEPALGKKLKGKLAGKRSIWLGRTHRIIYVVEPTIVVLTIVQRRDAYR